VRQTKIKTRQDVDPKALGWPSDNQASSGFWCNHCYEDLRGLSWQEARETLEAELSLMLRINDSEDAVATMDEIADEFYEDPGLNPYGLDVGVAATVVALSALGCIPLSSCNGGCYGDFHHESYPLVVFCSKPKHVPDLIKAAKKAEVDLENDADGMLIVHTDDIVRLSEFARALIDDHPM
jgi:hypothetical protein